MIQIETLRKLANRRTPYREAFEAMGFRFRRIEVMFSPEFDSHTLMAEFECVCGKVERLQQILPPFHYANDEMAMAGPYLDPARILIHDIGSTSPKHLREDGYTEEQIAEIQRKGREALARLQ
jgi:hypothetical protein